MTEPVDVEKTKDLLGAIAKNHDAMSRTLALHAVFNDLNDLIAERDALKAEVERLREVLRRIAATHSSAECEMDGYGKVRHGIDCPQKLAIDGLGETGNV